MTLTVTPAATCSAGHAHMSAANAAACESDTCPTCWGVGATSRGACGRCAGRGTYGSAMPKRVPACPGTQYISHALSVGMFDDCEACGYAL